MKLSLLLTMLVGCGVLAATIAIPLQARTIQWAGLTWDVKNGNGLGPGPNNWSDSTDSVWIDSENRLHLNVRRRLGKWYCAEVIAQQSLGFGKYEFQIDTNTESYDRNVVAGFFTYASDTEEIDIELTKFGDPSNTTGHYTVQPYTTPGNTEGFNLGLAGNFSTHSFDWTASAIDFQSLHGHYSTPPNPSYVIHEWSYTGADIPSAGSEKLHLNLWLFQGKAPTNRAAHELVISSFSFTPAGGAAALAIPEPASLFSALSLGVLLLTKRSEGI